MNECINSYATIKNIVHSLIETLNQFNHIFIFMKKLSLVTGTDGLFRISGDCFCSISAEPRYLVNSHPRDLEYPIRTGY